MSETFEERESRLQHRREGRRRVQQDKSNELTASEAQCTTLDEAGLLHECSKDIKSKILRELGFSLGPSGMDQCVCCVCDRLVFATTVHVYSTEDKGILQSMAARLRNPDAKLSAELVAFYDCKDIHPSFGELMLSRKGITHAGNVNDNENPSDVNFNVCFECESVLLQPWLSELPRHYVFPGEPVDSERDIDHEFDDDDGHAIAHADEDNDGNSMDALADYRVVLAGPFTKDQLVKVKEYHLVRQAMIMDVLQFYKSNNRFYADVSIDGDLIASLPVEDVLDGIIDEALGVDEKASAVDNEQAAVNGFSGDPDEGSGEHECAYVERSVLFTQTASDMAPMNEKVVLEALNSKIHQRTPRADPAVPEFNVHTSNKISNYFGAGIDARMFPHLFPFGRGYTNERGRRVPVSKLQCCRLYCSLSSRGIQVKSLFDVQYLKYMPDKATMQQLAMNDNMASATFFDRSIEAFIKVVVGFDKSTGQPRKTGGLFGHVKAYFGMVETQGRGTLHLHLLVWVYGAPRSTSEFEARLQADLNYEAMVLKYSEGITCEHADTKYEALNPPLTAFEKPRRSEGVLPKEPIMAKCGHCNTMVSSQHLVRQALLHSRPKVWPVELPKLSQSAIDKYLDEEAVFLKSTAGKKYDPERAHDHMRSSFQAYLEGTVHMESNVDYQELLAGARANLEESNTASNTYGAPDKDTFCLDPIYRELSSMPFGPNETRLPDETVLFVIAALASVLQ
ncbi:hypothetical protein B5M09_013398, partial [Aphanomyces astaci]